MTFSLSVDGIYELYILLWTLALKYLIVCGGGEGGECKYSHIPKSLKLKILLVPSIADMLDLHIYVYISLYIYKIPQD